MFSAFATLAGVGFLCASGIAISSGLKFFHDYEFDLAAKLKESKREEKREEATKRTTGGVEHGKRMEGLSHKFNKQ